VPVKLTVEPGSPLAGVTASVAVSHSTSTVPEVIVPAVLVTEAPTRSTLIHPKSRTLSRLPRPIRAADLGVTDMVVPPLQMGIRARGQEAGPITYADEHPSELVFFQPCSLRVGM
jgi:hypothetical protein